MRSSCSFSVPFSSGGFEQLMHQAVAHHLFVGVSLRVDGVMILHMQYADDTLLTEDTSVDNSWAMKTIL